MLTDLGRRSRRKETKHTAVLQYSVIISTCQRGANWACDGEEKKEKERTNRSGWQKYYEAYRSSDLEVTH